MITHPFEHCVTMLSFYFAECRAQKSLRIFRTCLFLDKTVSTIPHSRYHHRPATMAKPRPSHHYPRLTEKGTQGSTFKARSASSSKMKPIRLLCSSVLMSFNNRLSSHAAPSRWITHGRAREGYLDAIGCDAYVCLEQASAVSRKLVRQSRLTFSRLMVSGDVIAWVGDRFAKHHFHPVALYCCLFVISVLPGQQQMQTAVSQSVSEQSKY